MKQEDDLDRTRYPRLASTSKDLRAELYNLREKYPDMGINEWISLVRAKYTRHVNRLWLPPEKLTSARRLASAQACPTDKYLQQQIQLPSLGESDNGDKAKLDEEAQGNIAQLSESAQE